MRADQRRGARLRGSFLVAVQGQDPTPIRRRGDISVTGLFFETEDRYGEAGTVRSLTLMSDNDGSGITVMARLVREVIIKDQQGEKRGIAFEFMLEGSALRASLEALVRSLVRSQIKAQERFEMSCSVQATIESPSGEAIGCVIRRMGSESLDLSSEAPLLVGSMIRVSVGALRAVVETVFEGMISECRMEKRELRPPEFRGCRFRSF